MQIMRTVKVPASLVKISLHAKVCDELSLDLHLSDGEVIEYEGYVPSFIPGCYGDYIELEIDPVTGMITNWEEFCTAKNVQEFFEQLGEN